MDLRQLRYFIALAEELHFGRAAQRLHLAQPALSQQLKLLESELGLRLLDRTNRSVGLTDAGGRLLAEARDVLERFDQAVATMARVRTGDIGLLVLAVSATVDAGLLQRLVAGFRERAPGADIEPRPMATANTVTALLRHEVEAGLLRHRPDHEDVQSIVLAQEELGVALPSGSPLGKQPEIEPAQLSGSPLVWLRRRTEPDLYDQVLSLLSAAGYEPGPVRETPSVEASLSLVAAGLGVSLKHRREVGPGTVGVVWRPLGGVRVKVPTVLAFRRNEPAAPPLRQLQLAARAERRRKDPAG